MIVSICIQSKRTRKLNERRSNQTWMNERLKSGFLPAVHCMASQYTVLGALCSSVMELGVRFETGRKHFRTGVFIFLIPKITAISSNLKITYSQISALLPQMNVQNPYKCLPALPQTYATYTRYFQFNWIHRTYEAGLNCLGLPWSKTENNNFMAVYPKGYKTCRSDSEQATSLRKLSI